MPPSILIGRLGLFSPTLKNLVVGPSGGHVGHDRGEAVRQQAWERLATDLDPELLERMTTVVPLGELLDLAPQQLSGGIRGRVGVDVKA